MARFARPYTLVSGRTRPLQSDLALEALVTRTSRGDAALGAVRNERREILELAAEPVSIAEVSGRLRLPLGVVRVLVDDLAADRLVAVDRPSGASPTIDLLERVLHGLEEAL